MFLTNVVKCCYNHSAYPDKKVINDQLKILAEEIRVVDPAKIIAFGGLVYGVLTGKKIKLADYWSAPREKDPEVISRKNVQVAPCYFPTGRGNPKKAAEILKKFA